MYTEDTYNELWLSSNKLHLSIRHSFNCDFLKCGPIPTHYNYSCIRDGTVLKTVTWVAETCLWLLRTKNLFIISSAFVGLLKILHIWWMRGTWNTQKWYFLFSTTVQTGSRVHPASCSMGTRGSFSAQSGRDVKLSTHSDHIMQLGETHWRVSDTNQAAG
jgi:hypothetical protein